MTMREHRACPDCQRPIADKVDEGDHNTGNCGCEESRALCWREWSPDGLCRRLSVYDPDHDEANRPVERRAVLDFVKSLTKGPCSCQYNMGSFGISWDPVTGAQKVNSDIGPRTYHCLRCRSREALERDNIPYEKDDRAFTVPLGVQLDPATACKTFVGETFVVSGSVGPVGVKT